jgi:conjugal transfer pilus assembly protein TraW
MSLAWLTSYSETVNDLGVIGKTYSIAEESMLDLIKRRLQSKVDSGEVDTVHQRMKDRSVKYVERPPGAFLPSAAEYRVVEIETEYTTKEDILGADGKVLFPAGTTVNPLTVHPINKTMCFFDGDNSNQVEWVKKVCTNNPLNKLILVNGNYVAVSKYLGIRAYFDQRGYLVNKLGIRSLPAVLRQSGDKLYLEEFPVDG